MKPRACITLSWDDGHPLDMQIADLMARHGLRGTFYIPRTAAGGTLSTHQIRDLAGHFEIGAHTLGHSDLTAVSDAQARREIVGSMRWLEDVTGQPCVSFCPPRGRFRRRHLTMMEEAGYRLVRTVELLSLDWPRPRGTLWEMPTSVQAWPHDARSYVQNATRRGAAGNLWRYLRRGSGRQWPELLSALLAQAERDGGVVHLWGHSWEVTDGGGWDTLAYAMRLLAERTATMPSLTNAEVGRIAAAGHRRASIATKGEGSGRVSSSAHV